MMNWRNLVWWGGYASIGISLQAVLPGLDFLLPGLILAIQERKKAQFLWVAALFLLIQEGTGSMLVGGTLVSYGLGVVHYVTTALMSGLQGIPFHAPLVMDESVIQTLMTPFLWRFAQFTRRFCHEARV